MLIGSWFQCDLSANFFEPRLPSEIDLPDQIVPWLSVETDACVDKLTVVRTRNLSRRTELHQRIVDREPRWRFRGAHDGAVTRPVIILGFRHHKGPDRIQNDVAQHLEIVGIFIDQERFETTLEKM